MFVHDFACGWLENPFFKNSLLIKDHEMVEKVIINGIKELFIDTEKGVAPKNEKSAPAAQVVDELPEEIETAGAHVFSMITFEKKLNGIEPRGLREELPDALKLREEMETVLEDVFNTVLSGDRINMSATVEVSKKMVESTFRNDTALPCIAKVQTTGKYLVSRALNVSSLMIAFARHLGMQPQEMIDMTIGSLLHDIGMLRVNQYLVNKKEKLTPQELDEIRMHVLFSYDIVSEAVGDAPVVSQMALLHHERFDGSGYPHGVGGEDIPKMARMLAIVDIFDAITTPRVYGEAINLSAANRKLLGMVGEKQVDEALTHHFIRCIGIYPVGTMVRLSSGKMGIVIKQNPDSLLTPVVKIIYDDKKNGFIRPRNLNLAAPPEDKAEEKIVSAGVEKKFKINPIDFLLA